MVQMRPSEHALATGIPSAIGWGLLAGWRFGLTILIMFLAIAFAMRKLGPRAGMGN